MVYSNEDSWLDGLAKHNIFELNDQETKRIESIKSIQTRQQGNITDFVLQHHNRVIALRDNDLFVAVGCQIRVLSLTELKDAWVYTSKKAAETNTEISENWIHFVPYKLLDTPEINFNIESMAPNKNGRLLSVNGTHRLVVVCLPRQGFSDVSVKKKVDCRTLSIGNKYYDQSRSDILKIQWHPLSETRTHLVVLGNDNILRIFDISVDLEEPEQSFDLSPNDQKKPQQQQQQQQRFGFSINDEDTTDEDAVTFSIGSASQDQSGWEPFTVFYALRSGHIYSLCPVIPYRSVVRRNHLDNLSCISEVKYEQTKKVDKTIAHLYRLQTEWINSLFLSAKISSSNNNTDSLENDKLTVISSDDHMAYPVQRQGPFLINHTQPLENGVEVTDTLFINVDPVNVLAIAMNNGTVHNYILGSEIDAQWQLPVKNTKHAWERELAHLLTDAEYLPRASLYETINLKAQHLPPFQRVSLLADPLYHDTYYAYHAGGVHAIAMAKWVKQLGQLVINFETRTGGDPEKGLSTWLNEKTTSDVRLLVNSSPFQNGFIPIIGLVLITDIYLSYSLLALTCDYRLVTRDLNMRRDFSVINKESENAVKTQLKNLGSNNDPGYQPLLSLPAFQLPKELDTLPKQARIVVPPEMGGNKEVVITEETLLFFNKSSEQIRRETHNLNKAAAKIDNRLQMQQKEFERQVIVLRDLYDRVQAVQSPQVQATQHEKLKEMSARHAKLRLRIDEQLRQLMSVYQPDLSNEEMDWINKLEKLSKQIGGESGYKARIELLQSQIEQLSIKSQAGKASKPKISNNVNQTQLNNVLRTLKQQTSSINDAKQRVENLENKLPTTVA